MVVHDTFTGLIFASLTLRQSESRLNLSLLPNLWFVIARSSNTLTGA
jgi:hypothetical protein